MALNNSELVHIRQRTALTQQVNYTKAQINAVATAAETQIQTACKQHIANAMEAAAPGVFSNAQKKKIGAEVFYTIFGQDK